MDICVYGSKKNWDISLTIPGDKSIGHRSLIIGCIPKGKYKIENFSFSKDCLTTLEIVKKLGVIVNEKFIDNKRILYVDSPGYANFNKEIGTVNCNNSGTTIRLISGLLCGANIKARLIGDDSLQNRPMKRVIDPLIRMNGNIESKNGKLPLLINKNAGLNGIEYNMTVPSAQVKSAILIAGFLASKKTVVTEFHKTRNHTEKLFKYLGANININDNKISIENSKIESKDIFVPGDPSSAAFLIGATILSEKSKMKLNNVLLNEGRLKYVDILKRMGANISINRAGILNEELIGDIYVESSNLNGIMVKSDEIPNIIDEIPILSVLAAFAKGNTLFENVEELKYKECDRVEAIIKNLQNMGIKSTIDAKYNLKIKPIDNIIEKNIEIDSYNDHRIALAFLVASIKNNGKTIIKNYECTDISFPKSLNYFKDVLKIEKM